ncbi:MAG: TIGR00725 family protein [Myxococcales bacterium]
MAGRPYIAVVGAGTCDDALAAQAEAIGRALAEGGAIVVCGGLGGVMEAACRGAKSAGGTTLGFLPSGDRSAANRYLDLSVPTAMGEGRNVLVVRAADVVLAVGGEFGTLSEIALALKLGKPVAGLGTWELAKAGAPVEAIHRAATPDEAAALALRLAPAQGR